MSAFEWDSAVVVPDTRHYYGEPRFVSYGYIDERLMVLVFTARAGAIRLISLHKANHREVQRMGKIVRYTNEELRDMRERGEARTDWKRVDDQEPTIDKDSPELTDEEAARARPAREVLPELVGEKAAAEMLRRKRGPQKVPRKVPVSIRLSPEVIEHFRAGGRGWQSRIDEVLREWIRRR